MSLTYFYVTYLEIRNFDVILEHSNVSRREVEGEATPIPFHLRLSEPCKVGWKVFQVFHRLHTFSIFLYL